MLAQRYQSIIQRNYYNRKPSKTEDKVIKALEDFTKEVGIKERRNNYREEILKTKTV